MNNNPYFKRKIYNKLVEWKNKKDKMCLIVRK